MDNYIITAEIDQEWLDILGTITRHQEGFVWLDIQDAEPECDCHKPKKRGKK